MDVLLINFYYMYRDDISFLFHWVYKKVWALQEEMNPLSFFTKYLFDLKFSLKEFQSHFFRPHIFIIPAIY